MKYLTIVLLLTTGVVHHWLVAGGKTSKPDNAYCQDYSDLINFFLQERVLLVPKGQEPSMTDAQFEDYLSHNKSDRMTLEALRALYTPLRKNGGLYKQCSLTRSDVKEPKTVTLRELLQQTPDQKDKSTIIATVLKHKRIRTQVIMLTATSKALKPDGLDVISDDHVQAMAEMILTASMK